MSRLLAVPGLPGQDLPDALRHDHDGPAPTALEVLVEPLRVAGALLAERAARRWAAPLSVRVRTVRGGR